MPLIEELIWALCPGAPVDVADARNLQDELEYGSHSSIQAHTAQTMDKIVSDVIFGRTLVFKAKLINETLGLRVSPLGVVEEPKFRIINDERNGIQNQRQWRHRL